MAVLSRPLIVPCRECHAFDKGDNRLGPSLYGVVGRKAGTAPNFAYSNSLKGSGIAVAGGTKTV